MSGPVLMDLHEWSKDFLKHVIDEKGLDITETQARHAYDVWQQGIEKAVNDPRVPDVDMFVWRFTFEIGGYRKAVGRKKKVASAYIDSFHLFLDKIYERAVKSVNKKRHSSFWHRPETYLEYKKKRDTYYFNKRQRYGNRNATKKVQENVKDTVKKV